MVLSPSGRLSTVSTTVGESGIIICHAPGFEMFPMLLPLAAGYCNKINSVRLFSFRPDSVALSAIGLPEPNPLYLNRRGSIPRVTR